MIRRKNLNPILVTLWWIFKTSWLKQRNCSSYEEPRGHWEFYNLSRNEIFPHNNRCSSHSHIHVTQDSNITHILRTSEKRKYLYRGILVRIHYNNIIINTLIYPGRYKDPEFKTWTFYSPSFMQWHLQYYYSPKSQPWNMYHQWYVRSWYHLVCH